MIDHARPDQVIGAHRREQALQLQAVDEALVLEMVLECRQMALVDERRPVAHVGEVDQAADQGRRIDLVGAFLGGQPGQGNGDQSAAEAEGEHVWRLAGALADLLDGGDDAVEHIIADVFVALLVGRVDPADDEHGATLLDQPFDQALPRHQVDHVISVHQRRHVEQRLGGDFVRRGVVLDQLEQVILEHDLAGRGGDGLAFFEGIGIGAALDQALAAGQILDEVGEALNQIGAVGLLGALQNVRVGMREVGRRDGVQILVQQEAHGRPAAAFDIAERNHVPQLLAGQQIGIADRAEKRVVLPLRRGKAAVARGVARLAG